MNVLHAAAGDIAPAAPGGHPASWVATGRSGGVSTGPFAQLNLADHVGDDPDSVGRNRALLAESVGLRADALAVLASEHGGVVHTITEPGPLPAGDGVVTTAPGIGVVALGADCVTIALASTSGTACIGAAHCGWRGLVAGIVEATVEAMRVLGADEISAVLGPSVCAHCYPVSTQRLATLAAGVSARVLTAATWLPGSIDVAAGVREQFADLGVSTHTVPGCTAHDPGWFSYRRDRITGRQGMIVVR